MYCGVAYPISSATVPPSPPGALCEVKRHGRSVAGRCGGTDYFGAGSPCRRPTPRRTRGRAPRPGDPQTAPSVVVAAGHVVRPRRCTKADAPASDPLQPREAFDLVAAATEEDGAPRNNASTRRLRVSRVGAK